MRDFGMQVDFEGAHATPSHPRMMFWHQADAKITSQDGFKAKVHDRAPSMDVILDDVDGRHTLLAGKFTAMDDVRSLSAFRRHIQGCGRTTWERAKPIHG
jgi:hypothetical protein